MPGQALLSLRDFNTECSVFCASQTHFFKMTEMPTTKEYSNQYFKIKIFMFLNRKVSKKTSILKRKCLSFSMAEFYKNSAIQHDKHFKFKILVTIFFETLRYIPVYIFRSGWHL